MHKPTPACTRGSSWSPRSMRPALLRTAMRCNSICQRGGPTAIYATGNAADPVARCCASMRLYNIWSPRLPPPPAYIIMARVRVVEPRRRDRRAIGDQLPSAGSWYRIACSLHAGCDRCCARAASACMDLAPRRPAWIDRRWMDDARGSSAGSLALYRRDHLSRIARAVL